MQKIYLIFLINIIHIHNTEIYFTSLICELIYPPDPTNPDGHAYVSDYPDDSLYESWFIFSLSASRIEFY